MSLVYKQTKQCVRTSSVYYMYMYIVSIVCTVCFMTIRYTNVYAIIFLYGKYDQFCRPWGSNTKQQILSASCNKIYVHLFYLNKKIKNMATFVNIKVFSCLHAGKYAFCHFKVPMQKQASFFN